MQTAEYVAEAFKPGGWIASSRSNYEARVGQIEASLTIADAMARGARAHVFAEAATGVGKSFSYLVPAIHRAVEHQERVVIAVPTIALQEQLVRKDLPALERALPTRFTYALAKGVGNFLCKYEFDGDDDGLVQRPLFQQRGAREEGEQLAAVREWARTTVEGDLAELPFELEPKVRLRVATTSDECLGKACPKKDSCFALAARRRVKGANVVVTNMSLFFIDLLLKQAEPDKGVLPPYQHVVFDEAHDAPEVARDFFGWRVSPGAVRRVSRFLKGGGKHELEPIDRDGELGRALFQTADHFFDRIDRDSKEKGWPGRYDVPGRVRGVELRGALGRLARAYAEEASRLSGAAQEALVKAAEQAQGMANRVELAEQLHEPDRHVYYVEDGALAMKPIDVAPYLRQMVFESDRIKSAIMSSATLSAGGSTGFSFFAKEVGCGDAVEISVPSPFDYERNALVYLPKEVPDPNSEGFAEAVADVVCRVADAADGRTMALFTSFKVLKVAAATLRERQFRVLVHGERPRTQLVEAFKRGEADVLLGSDSFWQGVDIPGEALSAVVIDKVPFSHRDDPVMQAVAARNMNWFDERALPQATVALKQGFGRLIRTATDRGVVAVCDRRVWKKNYGKKLLRAFPEAAPRTHDFGDVLRFFNKDPVTTLRAG